MPTNFRHAVNNGVGTTPIDVLTVTEGFTATVIGCHLANNTDYDTVNVSVFLVDQSSTQNVYIKDLTVPPNSAAKVITQGEKLIMQENTTLRIVSDLDGSIDAVVSYVEIS